MTHDDTWMRYAITHVMITSYVETVSYIHMYISKDKSQQRGIHDYIALSLKSFLLPLLLLL